MKYGKSKNIYDTDRIYHLIEQELQVDEFAAQNQQKPHP
jgi:hypothetical protein